MDTGAVNLVSAAECLEIVNKSLKSTRAGDSVKLLRYSMRRGSSDLVGFMGEYYKLSVCLEDKSAVSGVRELQYFVKTVPISNVFHKDECERKGFFPKETRIYAEILPNIQRYAAVKLYPECYYTRRDLLVLEDLSATPTNYRHRDADEPYTSQHHKLFLEHLAALHAASLAWEFNENVRIGEQFKDVLVEMQLTMRNEWYVTGIKGIMFLAKIYEPFQTARVQNLINQRLYQVLSAAETITEPSKRLHNVLCHRDSWDRNIFYKYAASGEPTGCCVVDFQLTRYSPPGLDVLFFLYGTTTAEQRQQYFTEYLDHYHAALQARLRALEMPADTITRAAFLQDCRRARLPVLILWAICKPLTMLPAGLANKMRAEEPEKFDYYMNTQRDELFLRVMAIDPTYKENIMWPIAEIIQILLDSEETINE